MTPTNNRNDPYGKFNFIVEIDGISSSSFLSVDGVESLTEVIDYRSGSEDTTPRRLPGYRTYGNIVLRRGLTSNQELWQWRQSVVNGQVQRRSGAIIVLSHDRQPVMRVVFREAWPCRWSINCLDALAQETIIEEVELVIENFEIE